MINWAEGPEKFAPTILIIRHYDKLVSWGVLGNHHYDKHGEKQCNSQQTCKKKKHRTNCFSMLRMGRRGRKRPPESDPSKPAKKYKQGDILDHFKLRRPQLQRFSLQTLFWGKLLSSLAGQCFQEKHWKESPSTSSSANRPILPAAGPTPRPRVRVLLNFLFRLLLAAHLALNESFWKICLKKNEVLKFVFWNFKFQKRERMGKRSVAETKRSWASEASRHYDKLLSGPEAPKKLKPPLW